jgi:hypothetical protein
MDLGRVDTWRYFLAVTLVLILLFAWLGPQGTADGGFLLALFQWTVQVAVPLALAIACQMLLSRNDGFERLGAWWKLVVSGVLGGLLFSPIALAMDFWLGADDQASLADAGGLLPLLVDEMVGVVPPVTLVWVAINAPRVLNLDFSDRPSGPSQDIGDRAASPGVSREAPDSTARKGFRALLPPGLSGQDVVYLKSELHYLRVVTAKGSALVLYALRDAVAELGEDRGIQPHRSYWVSLDHVLGVRRTGKGWRLDVTGGDAIPVSRRRQAVVRAALSGQR